MKSHRVAIVAFLCASMGFMAGEHSGQKAMAEEIAANQAICDRGNKNEASYPVTFWGELRGCMHIPEKSPVWAGQKSFFVKLENPGVR